MEHTGIDLKPRKDQTPKAPKNVPLTTDQKLTVMSIQRKQLIKQIQINNLAKEITSLEHEMQNALKAIGEANGLDPQEVGLDDDLNIVPVQK